MILFISRKVNQVIWAEIKNIKQIKRKKMQSEKNNLDIMKKTKNISKNEISNTTGKISGIYIILNKIDNKWYVGSSEDILTPNIGRWYKHKYMLKNNCHDNKHLQNAYNKYGNVFEYHIVEIVPSDKLLIKEQKYLDYAKLHKNQVYNLTFVAGKIEMTGEIRQKISNKAKERLKNKENHPLYGKHHSKKTRLLISKNSVKFGKDNGMFDIHRFGKDNPNFNGKIYTFINLYTTKIYIGNRYDFCKRFSENRNSIRDIINKKQFKTKSGWTIKI